MTLTRRRSNPALCLLLALAGFASQASAQEAPATDDERTQVTVDGRRTTIEHRLEGPPLVLRVDPPPNKRCSAEIQLSYVQKDTVASVEGIINNGVCAASSGEYTLAATVRGESGETQTLEFTETWQRTDNQELTFEGDYPIGTNVELLRVRTRRMSCTCVEAPVAPTAGE